MIRMRSANNEVLVVNGSPYSARQRRKAKVLHKLPHISPTTPLLPFILEITIHRAGPFPTRAASPHTNEQLFQLF